MIQRLNKSVIETVRAAAKDFNFFRDYFFQDYKKYKGADFQNEISAILQEITWKRGQQCAFAAPRESAKSTLITLQYVLYLICNDLEKFILIASFTSRQAEDFLSNIKAELQNNKLLALIYPQVCEFFKKPKPSRWRANEIITKNDIRVLAIGSDQESRGQRHKEARPTLIIGDDIEPGGGIHSAEVYKKLKIWLSGSIFFMGDKHTNKVLLGTVHHQNSILQEYTDPKKAPGWTVKIYKSIIKESLRPELWEEWKKIYFYQSLYNGENGPLSADRYYEDNKDKMLEGTQVLWQESKSYYDLMKLKVDDEQRFQNEMQNEPIDPAESLFPENEIGFVDNEHPVDLVARLNLQLVAVCDPSLGKKEGTGSPSAIVVAGRDPKTGIIYVLEADIQHRKPDQILEDILACYKRWPIAIFGIEAVQYQAYLAQQVQKEGNIRGIYPRIEEIQQSGDKDTRISTLRFLIKNGTLRFFRTLHTLLDEMKYFPRCAHKDGLDALEMIVRIFMERSLFDLSVYSKERDAQSSDQEYSPIMSSEILDREFLEPLGFDSEGRHGHAKEIRVL